MGQSTGEEVLSEVEVCEALTERDVERKCGVDGVVVEGDGGEIGEATEDRRERSGDVGVGEVDGVDRAGGAASNAGPGTGCLIFVVPVGKGRVRVVEGMLDALEVKTLLVKTQNGRCRTEDEESGEEEKHCF